VKLKKKVFG